MSMPDPIELWQEVLGWIGVAEHDRRIAELCLDAMPPEWEGAAYHCQQAAEKLLKGCLVRTNTDFGRTHDLEYLGELVARQLPQMRRLVSPMAAWTHWAIAYRYPDDQGPEPDPSNDELREALLLIEQLAAALRALDPHRPASSGQ